MGQWHRRLKFGSVDPWFAANPGGNPGRNIDEKGVRFRFYCKMVLDLAFFNVTVDFRPLLSPFLSPLLPLPTAPPPVAVSLCVRVLWF